MKQFFIIGVMGLTALLSYGQNDFQNQFDEFRQETRLRYKNYNDSINKVFAKSLEENWINFQVKQAIPTPKKPLPQMDISTSKVIPDTTTGLPIDSIIQQKDRAAELELWDFTDRRNENARKVMINYFGSDLQFHYVPEFMSSITDKKEKTIANAWNQLSDSPYKAFINDLLFYRNDMNLDDWGMFQLLNQVAGQFFPESEDVQVLFSTFIMNQLGFRMKIGRSGDRLVSLIPFQTTVYGKSFINFDDERYYVFGNVTSNNDIYSYTINYPNANQRINLRAKRPFRLALSLYTQHCKMEDNKTFDINVNKNLMDLYQTYPQTEIMIYANNPLSGITRKSLENEIFPLLANKTEEESVTFLLKFVQTAFPYKNDIEQFGQEKFFFAEELFYYPFSDCEDRAVLFSQLVRRFLGLQVVLLDYPDHVTTAVKFTKPVSGDFVNILGEKYIICDPTYLHAEVSQSIPRYKTQKAKIYLLD